MTACRPMPDHHVREVYTFEIMSSTDWASPTNVTDAFATNYAINLVIILALYKYNKLVFSTNKRLFKNILQLFSSINLLYNR